MRHDGFRAVFAGQGKGYPRGAQPRGGGAALPAAHPKPRHRQPDPQSRTALPAPAERGRERPHGHPRHGAELCGRGQPAALDLPPRQHQGGEHPPGRERGAQGLHPRHLQGADEPDQGLPPLRTENHRQDLYLFRLQVPHRPAYPYEREPPARAADRAGHPPPDPLSALLYQEAGAARHGGAAGPAGRTPRGGGAGARGLGAHGQIPRAAH